MSRLLSFGEGVGLMDDACGFGLQGLGTSGIEALRLPWRTEVFRNGPGFEKD